LLIADCWIEIIRTAVQEKDFPVHSCPSSFALAPHSARATALAKSWPLPDRLRENPAVTRALVVDPHPLFRWAIRDLIESTGAFRVIAQTSSGRDAVESALALNPDLVLLDLRLRDMDGIQALRYLREARVDTRVAFITASRDSTDLQSALRAGADGYLTKDTEPASLLQQLHRVVEGRLVLGDRLGESLAMSIRADHTPEALERAGLTAREREILQRLADGCSNARIAILLQIAESTVKVHVKHLLHKLGLHSRVEAAMWCLNGGRRRTVGEPPVPEPPGALTAAETWRTPASQSQNQVGSVHTRRRPSRVSAQPLPTRSFVPAPGSA
jgi:two-component system, NarL family, nitrate/nitrite response regulator NarL